MIFYHPDVGMNMLSHGVFICFYFLLTYLTENCVVYFLPVASAQRPAGLLWSLSLFVASMSVGFCCLLPQCSCDAVGMSPWLRASRWVWEVVLSWMQASVIDPAAFTC